MIFYFIELLSSYLSLSWCRFWLFPFVALAFLSVFPSIIRSFTSWR